jgi:hypothetical protein
MASEIGSRKGEPYPKTAQRYEQRFGRAGLLTLLGRLLSSDNIDLGRLDIHHALFDFPFLDIFTTNQDLVIEAGLGNLSVPYTVVRRQVDLVTAKPLVSRRVIKYHGDLEYPDGIVFTQQDFKRRLRRPTWLDAYLAGRLVENAVLFVGYGLRDPNVLLAWNQIRRNASPDTPPVAFRLLLDDDAEEIRRMESLGIEAIVVKVSNRDNPVELLSWLHEVRAKAEKETHDAFEEYLGHGKVRPARSVVAAQLAVAERRITAGESADQVLRETLFYQRIPTTLLQEAERLALTHLQSCDPFWLWQLAVKSRLKALAKAALGRMAQIPGGLGQAGRYLSVGRTLDDWSLPLLAEHLEKVDSKRNLHDPTDHVVALFDAISHVDLDSRPFDPSVMAQFAEIRGSYFAQFPVLAARAKLRISGGAPDFARGAADHVRRLRVEVADRKASKVATQVSDRNDDSGGDT